MGARCGAGPCARCEVVCCDPATGVRTGAEPLLTLASFRRTRGSINFGVLLGGGRPVEDAGDADNADGGSGGSGGGSAATSGDGAERGSMLKVGMPLSARTADEDVSGSVSGNGGCQTGR